MGNKKKGIDFSAQRARWLEGLIGDDRNSVRVQLQSLSWDVAAFTIIGEAIKLSPRNEIGRRKVNSLIIDLLRVGFYSNLLSSLRRLTDRRKGTVSLTRILMEMNENSRHFTRSAILSAENKPYDYAPIRKAEELFVQQNLQPGKVINIPSELDWEVIADRHERIDRLVRKDESSRQPDDHLPKRLFENLLQKIESDSHEVELYANNFVAHAAGKNSETRKKADEIELAHDKLMKCHRSLCEVFNFVRSTILGDSSGPTLAYPAFDHFAFIDQPIVSSADVPKLRDCWERLHKESFEFAAWGVDAYQAEYCNRPQE